MSFSYQRQLMVFHKSLSNIKFPQVFKTLLIIFRRSRFVLRFPTLPVPSLNLRGPFQVHQFQLVSPSPSWVLSFLTSQARFKFLPFFSLSLIFSLGSTGTANFTIRQVLLFVGLCIWSNLNFLHSSQWIIFPIQLCFIIYHLKRPQSTCPNFSNGRKKQIKKLTASRWHN